MTPPDPVLVGAHPLRHTDLLGRQQAQHLLPELALQGGLAATPALEVHCLSP